MLKIKNRYETEEFSSDAKITIGCMYSGSRLASFNLFRGFYVYVARDRFMIRNYLDSEFKEQTGPCRLHNLVRIDKGVEKWMKPKISLKDFWKPTTK